MARDRCAVAVIAGGLGINGPKLSNLTMSLGLGPSAPSQSGPGSTPSARPAARTLALAAAPGGKALGYPRLPS
jgi:hypothetical protein